MVGQMSTSISSSEKGTALSVSFLDFLTAVGVAIHMYEKSAVGGLIVAWKQLYEACSA